MADYFYPTLDQLIQARRATLEADRAGLANLLAATGTGIAKGHLQGAADWEREYRIAPRSFREQLVREGYIPHKVVDGQEVPLDSQEFQEWWRTGSGDYILKKPVAMPILKQEPKEILVRVNRKTGTMHWVDPVTGEEQAGTALPPMEGYRIKTVLYGEDDGEGGKGGGGGGGGGAPKRRSILDVEKAIKSTRFQGVIQSEIHPSANLPLYITYRSQVRNMLDGLTDVDPREKADYIDQVEKEKKLIEALEKYNEYARQLKQQKPEELRAQFIEFLKRRGTRDLPRTWSDIVNAYPLGSRRSFAAVLEEYQRKLMGGAK